MGNCMCIPSGKVRSKLQALKHVPHTVRSLFEEHAGEKGFLNVEDVQRFLNLQGIKSSPAQTRQLMAKCEKAAAHDHPHLHLKRPHVDAPEGQEQLDLAGFYALLLDADVNAVHDVSKVTHDMSLPLSHYYWYTSHNSYLSGNQLTSDSSAAPIVDALRRGCRVIELDVWPDGENIKVVHGMTLCKPAPVTDLLMAIKEHAFVASEYPVVLTIENHLPPVLQKLLAQLLRDILGDQLFLPPSDTNAPLLSPADLVRRFIISDKPISETEEGVKGAKKAASDAVPGADDFLREGELDEAEGTTDAGKRPSVGIDGSTGTGATGAHDSSPPKETAEAVLSATVSNEAVPEYDDSFSSLIYIPCLKPNEYVGAFKGAGRVTMANVGEPAFEKLAKSGPTLLTKFARTNVIRVYPFGLRFDSSNLDPTLAWAHGAQLAAINMQGYGRHLWLQHGLFTANGGCGYVQKPDFFFPPGAVEGGPGAEFDPSAKRPVKTTLKIRIVSGRDTHKRFDALKPPDFFVRVAIYGVPADKKKIHTKTHKNTKHPIWEKEEFLFPLTVPELALLAIEVRESDTLQRDDFACQTCLPVVELKAGLRAIAMKDKKGNVIPDGRAKLLVDVSFVDAGEQIGGGMRILETPSLGRKGAEDSGRGLVDVPID